MNRIQRISRKNERIIFQKCTVNTDKYGNHKNIWTDYFSCYAYADTYTAAESGDEVVSENRSISFEVRYCPELETITSTGYRVIFRNEVYNIQSVDMMNYQRKSIKFMCRKERGHGQSEH